MADNDYRPDTILAADFGTATTRVSLFDVVEGTFRYVASGEAPSTVAPPYSDASEGLRHALLELQTVTGRAMLNDAARLILPATDEGQGCDVFVATASAGQAVRTVLVGLLPEVSLESARRLAESSYLNVVEALSLVDRRRPDQQLDALVQARPELVVMTGGTENGASAALLNLAEIVGLACFRLPPEPRVRILLAGNSALRDKLSGLLGNVASVAEAPNVQPALGQMNLDGPRAALAEIVDDLRISQIGGLRELAQSAGGHLLPTAQAEGQIVRFLSQSADFSNVLSVNIGSAATSVAAAFSGDLYLTVASDLGLGVNAANTLASAPLEQFLRWVPEPMSEAEVRLWGLNRSAYPHTVPTEAEDLHCEYALARLAVQGTLRRARSHWPRAAANARADLLPAFDLIVGGGAVLSQAPSASVAALLMLDALQPTGVTNLSLDRAHLLAALGAIAYANPLAAVQVLESGALLRLGVAFSLLGAAREGEVVCTAKLVTNDGQERTVTVKAGSIEVLPLAVDQGGKLMLKPRSGIDLGFGPGRGQTLALDSGGAVGIILDARGRPINFPRDPGKRAELVQQWLLGLGGL